MRQIAALIMAETTRSSNGSANYRESTSTVFQRLVHQLSSSSACVQRWRILSWRHAFKGEVT